MNPPVLLEIDAGVATITLNRPDAANSLNLELAAALTDTLDAVADDPRARVVLLRGSGQMFCAGGDLQAMNAAPARGPFLAELAHAMHVAIKRLVALDKVVVTEVQGAAAGAGLSLVLASDIVIAAESARFITAYATVGLTPDCGQSWLLPRVVGLRRAFDLTLEPRRLSAREALDWGLISRVAIDDQLESESEKTSKRLAAGPAEALGRARILLREGLVASFEDHLDSEAAAISHMASTTDTGNRIDAFLNPRAKA